MPKAYKHIIFSNLDGDGSKAKVVNTQTGVYSRLFLRLRNFQLKRTSSRNAKCSFLAAANSMVS